MLSEVTDGFTVDSFPKIEAPAEANKHLRDASLKDEEKDFIPIDISEAPEENSGNVDDVFDVSLAARGLVVTEEINKKLLRKIHLLPSANHLGALYSTIHG